MSRRLRPLAQLEGDQLRASSPRHHAALSASAGTGKTHVLTARVLRSATGDQAIFARRDVLLAVGASDHGLHALILLRVRAHEGAKTMRHSVD